MSELPRLVHEGVLDAATAERVRAHYGEEPDARGSVPLFAVLGAALVGLGIVLLVAHNWEALSRGERVGLSLALLVGAQGLAGYALLRRSSSVPWTEGAALFLVLACGATLGLLDQTYQVPGSLRGFLTRWLLLVLPLPLLFLARGAAALYLAGATAWLVASLVEERSIRAWWGWLAGATPLLVVLVRRGGSALRDAFLGWVAVPSVGVGLVLGFRIESVTGIALLAASVLGAIYACGAGVGERQTEPPWFTTPARVLAALAIAGIALQLGGVTPWEAWLRAEPLELPGLGWIDSVGAVTVGVACAAVAGWGALGPLRPAWPRALLAAFPALVALGMLAVRASHSPWAGTIVANAYGLALGVGITLLGMRERQTGLANAGLFFLAWLVINRFVDFELSYTVRGLSFIAIGVCFLLLNLRLRRTRRRGGA